MVSLSLLTILVTSQHTFQVAYRLLASFGSLARFKDVQRIFSVGDNTLIAYSGDVSDAQHIQFLLESLTFPIFPKQADIRIEFVNRITKMNICLTR